MIERRIANTRHRNSIILCGDHDIRIRTGTNAADIVGAVLTQYKIQALAALCQAAMLTDAIHKAMPNSLGICIPICIATDADIVIIALLGAGRLGHSDQIGMHMVFQHGNRIGIHQLIGGECIGSVLDGHNGLDALGTELRILDTVFRGDQDVIHARYLIRSGDVLGIIGFIMDRIHPVAISHIGIVHSFVADVDEFGQIVTEAAVIIQGNMVFPVHIGPEIAFQVCIGAQVAVEQLLVGKMFAQEGFHHLAGDLAGNIFSAIIIDRLVAQVFRKAAAFVAGIAECVCKNGCGQLARGKIVAHQLDQAVVGFHARLQDYRVNCRGLGHIRDTKINDVIRRVSVPTIASCNGIPLRLGTAEINLGQALTMRKCIRTNAGYAARNGNAGQARAPIEALITNVGDALRDGNAGQITTTGERIITNGSHRQALILCRDHNIRIRAGTNATHIAAGLVLRNEFQALTNRSTGLSAGNAIGRNRLLGKLLRPGRHRAGRYGHRHCQQHCDCFFLPIHTFSSFKQIRIPLRLQYEFPLQSKVQFGNPSPNVSKLLTLDYHIFHYFARKK